jgi:hypothetical protein
MRRRLRHRDEREVVEVRLDHRAALDGDLVLQRGAEAEDDRSVDLGARAEGIDDEATINSCDAQVPSATTAIPFEGRGLFGPKSGSASASIVTIVDSHMVRCIAHRVAGLATPLMSSHSASTIWNTSAGSHW